MQSLLVFSVDSGAAALAADVVGQSLSFLLPGLIPVQLSPNVAAIEL